MKTTYEYLTRSKKDKQPVNKTVEKKKTDKKKKKTVTISQDEYDELRRGYSPGTWEGDFMGQ